jgi:aspartyl-tRNA(Asn)/glutamyl-tRNA(Gln) amidotransferase subunit B
MEEGSMRCDANVSVRLKGAEKFGTRVELKNINSFRFLHKAIDYEINRQIAALEAGETIIQETRLWNENESKTYAMRSKEEAHDYRYFPEPDLPPLTITDEEVNEYRGAMPELPEARRRRFIEAYGLSLEDAALLVDSRAMADYYEATAKASGNPKAAANWILNELVRELKSSNTDISQSPISADDLGAVIKLIDGGTISGKMGKDALIEMYRTGHPADEVIRAMGGGQVSDEAEIRKMVEQAVAANPKQLEQYRAGKTSLMGFFVGQVMKASGGRANPQVVNKLLKEALDSGQE